MKPSECTHLFEVYHKLLNFYEPADAVLFLVLPQKMFDGQIPCELLAEKNGYARLLQALHEMGSGHG